MVWPDDNAIFIGNEITPSRIEKRGKDKTGHALLHQSVRNYIALRDRTSIHFLSQHILPELSSVKMRDIDWGTSTHQGQTILTVVDTEQKIKRTGTSEAYMSKGKSVLSVRMSSVYFRLENFRKCSFLHIKIITSVLLYILLLLSQSAP